MSEPTDASCMDEDEYPLWANPMAQGFGVALVAGTLTLPLDVMADAGLHGFTSVAEPVLHVLMVLGSLWAFIGPLLLAKFFGRDDLIIEPEERDSLLQRPLKHRRGHQPGELIHDRKQ